MMNYIRQKLLREGPIALSALLLALLAMLFIFVGLFGRLQRNLDPAAKRGTLSILDSGERSYAPNTISIIINTSPCFETGTSPGNIFFENPAHSGKLERLEIYKDSDGALIYKSGYLEPGTYIDYAPLSEDLNAGEYECTAVIYGYDIETQAYIGRVAAGILLYVLN